MRENGMIRDTQMFPDNLMLEIPIDQGHEQNNACTKSGGGAVGLTDNFIVRRWMVAGPDVAALIEDFEDSHQLMGKRDDVLHCDQTSKRADCI